MTTNFEAKLHGFRRTQDGVVVSYVVHPSDVSAELATAALGTRYMVAVAEIGDDERPIGRKSGEVTTDDPEAGVEALATAGHPSAIAGTVQFDAPATNSKERRTFASLPLSQQCAMRCQDDNFQVFIAERAKWSAFDDGKLVNEVKRICGVSSRSELGDERNIYSRQAWKDLEAEYQAFLTDRQYAGAVR